MDDGLWIMLLAGAATLVLIAFGVGKSPPVSLPRFEPDSWRSKALRLQDENFRLRREISFLRDEIVRLKSR